MAYRFKLATVLNLRRTLEEQAQLRLAREQTILQGHIARLEALVVERQTMFDELGERLRLDLEATVYNVYMQALRSGAEEIRRQENSVEAQRQVVEKARQELIAKMQSKKVLERFRDRDHAAYREEEGKEEQRNFDELAILRHGRVYR